jgi:Spy/CpxP family protein refolding chaperone
MRLVKPFGLFVAFVLAVSSVVIAQSAGSRSGLVKPWSDLTTLTDEQKAQIVEIHARALEEMRVIRNREREEIMAVLTDENKAELTALQQQQRAEQKARRAANAGNANAAQDNNDDD